jgi:hypothetical protein
VYVKLGYNGIIMSEDPNFYISGNKEKQEGLEKLGKAMASQDMAVAGFYSNLEEGISVRPPFTRHTYERFRPGERIPEKDDDIMTSCRDAYQSVGVIRSVVDLITETAVEGLEIVSENEGITNFFKSWSQNVNLRERAERFANYFVVEGNVVVRKKIGKIDIPTARRMKRGSAATKNVSIPIGYIFYDPQTIRLIGGPLAIFADYKKWGVKVSNAQMQTLKDAYAKDSEIVDKLPAEIKEIIMSKGILAETLIPIPHDEVWVAHYKKKDSEVWAKSFIFSILHDVIYNEKLRLAKISALDSWYNSIRIWKLGDHKEEILPDSGSIVKLAKILENHTGGNLDIIWDSMLTYEQFFPPIEKLENFKENYESMLLGLGVHQTLIGGTGSTGGDSFVGLRNLMKRIDCVRRAMNDWITNEIDEVCDVMGFQDRPKVRFNNDNLFDQPSYFKLLVELVDRGVVSNETAVTKIGEMWDIEKSRIKSEEEARKNKEMPEKLGPFIQPKISESNFKKNKEMQGLVSETAGPQVPPGKPGRPAGSKDTVTRSPKKKTRADVNNDVTDDV